LQTAALNSPFAGRESEAPPARRESVDYSTRIWGGFALALASLVLVGAVGPSTTRSLINRDGWVNHTRIVIDALRAVGSTVKSLQGNLFGYAATGGKNYLQLAQVESKALDGEVDGIRELVVDNREQSRRVADLAVLLDACRRAAQRSIAAATEGDLPTAAARILHGPGLALSDEIARQVAEMSAVEKSLLAARDAAAGAAGRESLALIAFGSLFAVFFVGLAGVFIARALAALRLRNQELARSDRHLHELNLELDEQRAAAEQRSRDLWASEHALHSQTDLLEAILEGMAEGVLARASDGRLLLSNSAARRILPGGSFDPGSTFATFMADYEIFLDEFGTPIALAETALSQANSGIQTDHSELYLRRRSTGENLCLESSARPLRDRRGEMFGAMVVFRDITRQKRAEREQARLAAVVQSSSDAIISGTPDGVIASFNPGAERLYGYTADEVIGRNFSILEPSDRVGEIDRIMRESLEQRGGVRYETRRMRRGGGIFDAEVIDSPIYDRHGREIGLSAIVRDISERRQSERDLAERTRDLERSNLELEQFAYSASHDLQEPLRMVGSYVQLLRDRYRGRLDSDADDFIDFAVDGAVRMKQLINDLLLYSRTGRGHSSAIVESGEALDWAVANLALKLSDSGAVVNRGAMPPVMADASQLGQLFQNLIDNALKFRTQAVPQIEIGAERRDALWEFCVRDNGIGIDQQHAQRIFQMFQRLHSSAEYPGTGIGLAVCRKIVERNGGSIWVDPEAHLGAAFRFTIPAVESAPGVTAIREAEQI
jgi:PAS domain S-box-containing protein